ncbi:hypothetical protein [uncultured Treponema sp.]|nr:hypothetical protein [uncultured Treponema sp.]
MTIKLDNTPSYGKPYTSGEYGNDYINWYSGAKYASYDYIKYTPK